MLCNRVTRACECLILQAWYECNFLWYCPRLCLLKVCHATSQISILKRNVPIGRVGFRDSRQKWIRGSGYLEYSWQISSGYRLSEARLENWDYAELRSIRMAVFKFYRPAAECRNDFKAFHKILHRRNDLIVQKDVMRILNQRCLAGREGSSAEFWEFSFRNDKVYFKKKLKKTNIQTSKIPKSAYMTSVEKTTK